MDWLRSEDLKEVKDVTAPIVSIAGVPLTGRMRDGDVRNRLLALISPVSQSKKIRHYPPWAMDLAASPSGIASKRLVPPAGSCADEWLASKGHSYRPLGRTSP